MKPDTLQQLIHCDIWGFLDPEEKPNSRWNFVLNTKYGPMTTKSYHRSIKVAIKRLNAFMRNGFHGCILRHHLTRDNCLELLNVWEF